MLNFKYRLVNFFTTELPVKHRLITRFPVAVQEKLVQIANCNYILHIKIFFSHINLIHRIYCNAIFCIELCIWKKQFLSEENIASQWKYFLQSYTAHACTEPKAYVHSQYFDLDFALWQINKHMCVRHIQRYIARRIQYA